MTKTLHSVGTAIAVALIAIAFAPKATFAAGNDVPEIRDPSPKPAPSNSAGTHKKKTGQESEQKKKKDEKKSEQEFIDGYKVARAMILDGRYEDGIAAMHALGHDDNADVANYIGYAERKLGNYDQSKIWYEAALKADPRHTRTWQYYGLWYLEQGNRLKAEDNLEQIRLICGTGCEDYVTLKRAIADGNISY